MELILRVFLGTYVEHAEGIVVPKVEVTDLYGAYDVGVQKKPERFALDIPAEGDASAEIFDMEVAVSLGGFGTARVLLIGRALLLDQQ